MVAFESLQQSFGRLREHHLFWHGNFRIQWASKAIPNADKIAELEGFFWGSANGVALNAWGRASMKAKEFNCTIYSLFRIVSVLASHCLLSIVTCSTPSRLRRIGQIGHCNIDCRRPSDHLNSQRQLFRISKIASNNHKQGLRAGKLPSSMCSLNCILSTEIWSVRGKIGTCE